MTAHGSSLDNSHAPQLLQCSARMLRRSASTFIVGHDPMTSTTTGGLRAISLTGPMIFLRQKSAPRRSRFVQANIKNSTIPGSIFGSKRKPSVHRARTASNSDSPFIDASFVAIHNLHGARVAVISRIARWTHPNVVVTA